MNREGLAKIVVLVNWILFGLLAIVLSCFLLLCFFNFDAIVKAVTEQIQNSQKETYSSLSQLKNEDIEAVSRFAITFIAIFGILSLIFQLGLNIVLTKGVNQPNRLYCNIWLILNLIFFILGCLGLLGRLGQVGSSMSSLEVSGFIIDIGYLIWLGFSLYIIKKWRDEFGTTNSAAYYYGGVVYSKP